MNRWEHTYQGLNVLAILLYSYYILGVPCLGFPFQSLYAVALW